MAAVRVAAAQVTTTAQQTPAQARPAWQTAAKRLQPTTRAAAPQQQQRPPTPTQQPQLQLMLGDLALSSEFRDWCREQLECLLGTEDLSLIKVLLPMEYRSEVADTCQTYNNVGNRAGGWDG
jgi:hypothetical protein